MTHVKILFLIGIFIAFVYVISTPCVGIEGFRGDNELCGNNPECIASYNSCGYQECIDKSPIDRSICLLKVGTCYNNKSMDKLRKQNISLQNQLDSLNSIVSSTVKMVTGSTSNAISKAGSAISKAGASAARTIKVSLGLLKKKRR